MHHYRMDFKTLEYNINYITNFFIFFFISEPSHFYKDLTVAVIVIFSTLLCVYAFHEKRVSKKQIENMSKDLVALQQAEDNLKALQET